jgi:HAE1 family hydrophobic/amphiphilic exporter-1
MARAIVGGLLFSTVVSLVFLPTIYTWLDAMRAWPAFAARGFKRLALRAGRALGSPVRATTQTQAEAA